MRTLHLVCAAALVAAALPAQQLTLSGDAGSYPGTFALTLGSQPVGTPGAVLLGTTAGPTPLNLVNPGDPRVLNVGLAGLIALTGVFLPPDKLTIAPIPVPGNPAFLDATIFMQGVAITGTPIIGPISQPQPVRFAPANAFRDRGTQLMQLGGRCSTALVQRQDQRTMLTGGSTGALWAQIASATTEIYDPVTDAFVAGPNLLGPRATHQVVKLANGQWLLVGGVDGSNNTIATAEIYDPATDTFTAAASMSKPRFLHTAHLLPNGKVMVIGGMTFNSITQLPLMIGSAETSTEIWDPATNTWSAGPSMSAPRGGHASFALPSGKILVLGGAGFNGPLPAIWTTTEIWDPATNTFTAGPAMSAGRAVPAVSPIGGGIYLVAGGFSVLDITTGKIGDVTASAELYDSTANTWAPAGSMAQGRALATMFDIGGGRCLLPGGAGGNIPGPIALASSEVYLVGSNTWVPGPALSMARLLYAGYVTPLGQVHLLGGATSAAATCTDTTEWYYR